MAAAAEVFAPGVVSTGFDDSHVTISPDGKTLYFLRNSADFHHWTILESKLIRGAWAAPEVAPFSGRWDDGDVFITPDGNHLFFISNRPARGRSEERRDTDIWHMTRGMHRWNAPRHVPELSSEGDEWFPTMTRRRTVYFGSDRPGGRGATDIWRAKWDGTRFSTPENIGGPINTREEEIEPLIDPDERFMIFAARRERASRGAYDLYISYNCPGHWSEPATLPGDINSAAWDFAPRLSPDGQTFFFTSNREALGWSWGARRSTSQWDAQLSRPGNGLRDIYQVKASSLPLDHQC